MFENLSERFVKLFEKPLPVLECTLTEIKDTCPPGFYTECFTVTNNAGGNLEGEIFARDGRISFSKDDIIGNNMTVEVTIDLNGRKPLSMFESSIILGTNGGTLIIPVRVYLTEYVLTVGARRVKSLAEFAEVADADFKEAVNVFAKYEFAKWLSDIGCEHIHIFNKITEREAGAAQLADFLIAAGVRKSGRIECAENRIEIEVLPSSGIVSGFIPLRVAEVGRFSYSAKLKVAAHWLALSKDEISSDAFTGSEHMFEIVLDTNFIRSHKTSAAVVFENGSDRFEVELLVKRIHPFDVYLSRKSYAADDRGFVVIENKTGKFAEVEIYCAESFVKFKTAKYNADEHTEIPFDIKTGGIINMLAGKKPVNFADVHVKVVADGQVYRDILVVKAGSLGKVV